MWDKIWVMKALILLLISLTFNLTLVEDINNHRASLNLPILQQDKELSQIAYNHSVYMESKGVLSHDNFNQRVKGKSCGECVSKGYEKPLRHWIRSVGHKNIIEGDYTKIGVGIKGEYVTIILKK